MTPNNARLTPRKSCLPANIVSKMNDIGQRKAISMVGMSNMKAKPGVKQG